ncbi:MAG: GntR family transcriptional regulator [Isosphaeraceae bacterium]
MPGSRSPATGGRKLAVDNGQRRPAIVGLLLADILGGRFRAGERLVTQDLSDRFGVSHTPIREALIELAGLGVIDLQPNRGAVVRRVTPRNVREIASVRRVLECEAVRQACGRIDPAELAELTAALSQHLEAHTKARPEKRAQFVEEARVIDGRLHDRIADSCGNAFLSNEIARLKTLFRTFRDVSWEHDETQHDYHRLVDESREHLAIVGALAQNDARTAARAMSRHITTGARYWSRVFRVAPVVSGAAAVSKPKRSRSAPSGTGS